MYVVLTFFKNVKPIVFVAYCYPTSVTFVKRNEKNLCPNLLTIGPIVLKILNFPQRYVIMPFIIFFCIVISRFTNIYWYWDFFLFFFFSRYNKVTFILCFYNFLLLVYFSFFWLNLNIQLLKEGKKRKILYFNIYKEERIVNEKKF